MNSPQNKDYSKMLREKLSELIEFCKRTKYKPQQHLDTGLLIKRLDEAMPILIEKIDELTQRVDELEGKKSPSKGKTPNKPTKVKEPVKASAKKEEDTQKESSKETEDAA